MKAIKFNLAMAGYTYNKFSVDQTLDALEKLDVHYLCVKNFHLPFNSTAAQIAEFKKKCADHGVTPYGVGPIYMSTPDEAKKYFDYTAALGVDVLVGVPGEKKVINGKETSASSRKMCEVCAKLAGEYKIKYAIHNHGANPKTGNPNLYPTVVSTYEYIKDLDPNIGFCMDIAYTYADGLDPAEIIRTYHKRIFDGHIRNINPGNNGSAGVSGPNGVINFRPIFEALRDVGYEGCLGLELANAFGKQGDTLWIPESIGYFRAICDSLKS
jgi:sugar phosphate isomerase/epimerase